MKLTVSKSKEPKGTISGLSMTEMEVILNIVDVANRRCFHVKDRDDNMWYSNSDFVMMLDDNHRMALEKIGKEIREITG